jgi:dihydropteroate synthase
VAKAAIEAGADMVNDVSGGTFDPEMLGVMAQLGVPVVLMHMRGTPETMQSMLKYDDVVFDVAAALQQRSEAAEKSGVHRWLQVVDPGIGFAKNLQGNLLLLKHLSLIRSKLDGIPVLIGTSRKGFIGSITGVERPGKRDAGTIASWVASLSLEEKYGTSCTIVRVHNVADSKQAALVMDAIRKSS